MKRYLFVALGFTKSDLDALHAKVRSKGYGQKVRIIGRAYPKKSKAEAISFREADLSFIIDATYRSLFGEGGRTLFCNQNHENCALKFGRSKGACVNNDPAKCRDSRPDVILLAYQAAPKYLLGGRLGRYALPLKCPANLFGKSKGLAEFCVSEIENIEKNQLWTLFNTVQYQKYLLLPQRNFKSGHRDAAVNAIVNPKMFVNYAQDISAQIPSGGGKIFDERDLEFKKDNRLHRFPSGDVALVDWLNAHYRHGFPFDNRYHYDVTSKEGGYVRNVEMLNLRTNARKKYSGDHLNIFPNDEVQ